VSVVAGAPFSGAALLNHARLARASCLSKCCPLVCIDGVNGLGNASVTNQGGSLTLSSAAALVNCTIFLGVPSSASSPALVLGAIFSFGSVIHALNGAAFISTTGAVNFRSGVSVIRYDAVPVLGLVGSSTFALSISTVGVTPFVVLMGGSVTVTSTISVQSTPCAVQIIGGSFSGTVLASSRLLTVNVTSGSMQGIDLSHFEIHVLTHRAIFVTLLLFVCARFCGVVGTLQFGAGGMALSGVVASTLVAAARGNVSLVQGTFSGSLSTLGFSIAVNVDRSSILAGALCRQHFVLNCHGL
jgi:hypothetical protein